MIEKTGNTFNLTGKNISYVFYVNKFGDLLHYHFGKKIAVRDYSDYMPWYGGFQKTAPENDDGLTNVEQEYPAYGHSDLRTPAYTVINKDKNAISRLKYKSYKLYEGKYAVEGMPSLFEGDCHSMTLEVTLEDEIAGFEAILYYSVFEEYDIITRCVKFVSVSDPISITCAYSQNLDLPAGKYETVHFQGSWGRERGLERMVICPGATVDISNARGGSGHNINPFVMVCEKGADETHGDVYGFSLIYSGDHKTVAACDVFGKLRVQMGINPHNFEWRLERGESFMTPECVMAYSPDGFERLSHTYHDVYRNNLCTSKWSKLDRPILINNWEGTYFDFNEKRLLEIAEKAAAVGCELFVLDDGWFGKRDDDTCSLGDWYVNTKKLACGIDGLAEKINNLGMKFGLWFEPEMVNPDSDLYRKHPDWAIHVPNREGSLGRNQLILDLSRDDVCKYIIESVSKILGSANISYVKWDMNRYMTDRPSLGYSHKYTLGLYRIMEGICSAFPEVLFEGCSAGGGRFDPGILAYMPQIWTSDNSDAVSRLKIQYGTSFAYPLSAISAHVTAVPNHQTGRMTSLGLRGAVATTGSFGYELDLTKLTDEELEGIKEQICYYKKIRKFIRTGTFYRLFNPFESNYSAWETVSKDGENVFATAVCVMTEPQTMAPRLKLRGLVDDAIYDRQEDRKEYYGPELMNVGIDLRYERDFTYENITLKRK